MTNFLQMNRIFSVVEDCQNVKNTLRIYFELLKKGLFLFLIFGFLFHCFLLFYIQQLPTEQENRNVETSLKKTQIPKYSENFRSYLQKRLLKRRVNLKILCGTLEREFKNDAQLQDFDARKFMLYDMNFDLMFCQTNQDNSLLLKSFFRLQPWNQTYYEYALSRRRRLITINSILIQQHPLQKLVEAYEAIVNSEIQKQYWVSKLQPTDILSLMERLTRQITFRSFLKYILQEEQINLIKYASVYSTCLPCVLQYKYVFTTETLQEDIFALLYELGIKEGLSSHGWSKFQQTSLSLPRKLDEKSFLEYFNDLPPDLLNDVYLRIREDLFLFGYEMPALFKDVVDFDDIL